METAQELREYCEKLHAERIRDLEAMLENYFYFVFIDKHKPFTAVIGNKKCEPVQIGKDLLNSHWISWPNISKELIRKEMERLGFVITPDEQFSISVPAYENGSPMSYAQRTVQHINNEYAEYCNNEKKIAQQLYSEFISKLLSAPVENIKTYDGFTVFCKFQFDFEFSSVCLKFFKRLMRRDGIEEYYEGGEYKGIKVYDIPK